MARRVRSGSYVVCVSNRGYRVSLVVRRIYRRLPDAVGQQRGLIRVVDESGEDYLFPSKLFVAIELPPAVSKTFKAAS